MRNQDVLNLFERAAGLLSWPTSGTLERKDGNAEYDREFLKLDYNSYYGGYVIERVLRGTGTTHFDGFMRRNKKEMTAYLEGLIFGIVQGHINQAKHAEALNAIKEADEINDEDLAAASDYFDNLK